MERRTTRREKSPGNGGRWRGRVRVRGASPEAAGSGAAVLSPGQKCGWIPKMDGWLHCIAVASIMPGCCYPCSGSAFLFSAAANPLQWQKNLVPTLLGLV